MNDQSLVGRMIQVCVRPKDVKKVRGLILSLAISGNLTSKEVSSEDISGTFVIPSDWKWCTLSEIAACRGSAKAGSDGIKPSDWILDMEDIDGATGTVHTRATFKERSSLSTKSAFKPGDVLYGKLRPYLNKVVLADSPGFCTTEIIPITPGSAVESRYLQLALRSPYFLTYVAKRSYGMKMPRLGTKDLESSRIPLPPLAEQKRIVAKVDELMALCDQLEAQLKDRDVKQAALAKAALAKFTEDPTTENLQQLFHPSFSVEPEDMRKTIRTLAVRGKLAPQDSNDEPAEDLLERLKNKKARMYERGSIRRQKPLPQLKVADLPFEVPSSWRWARLENTILQVTDGEHLSPRKATTGVKLLTAKHIRSEGVTLEDPQFVSESDAKKFLSRCNPEVGDIFICSRGTIGRSCVNTVEETFCLMGSVILLKKSDAIIPSYLDCFIKSEWGQLFIRGVTKGMAVNALYLKDVKLCPTPIPPLAEQLRIVANAEQLIALVDALETQLEASRITGEKLLEAMIAELTSA